MSAPAIHIQRPLKECVSLTGQRQSGKTKALEWLLKCDQNPTFIFDTLGVISYDIAKGNLKLYPNQRVFNPNWITIPDYKARLNVFLPWCDMVWRHGNCIAVVEEWHLFNNKKDDLPLQFGNLFNQGGNRNIAVRGTSQRPAQVHNDVLSACSHHFVFKMSMPADLDWMCRVVDKKYIKGDPNDQKAMCVRKMPPYHFLYYNTITDQADFFSPITI